MTDSYFAQARYYNSNIGRFVSRDAERFKNIVRNETLNIYEYCLNNPIISVDYNGHEIKPDYIVEGVEAHIFLEAYALKEFGLTNCGVEYPIEGGSFHGNGKYGYADIVIFDDAMAEIYEIKPGSYSVTGPNHSIALAQLGKYVRAFNDAKYTNTDRRNALGAIEGQSYNEVFQVAIPSVYKPGEYIVYRTYGDGLIIYDYQKTVPDNCEVKSVEKEAVLKSMQYYLHISDETMEKILVGCAIISTIALTAALVALVLDDASGFGTIDDAAVPIVTEELKGFILYLIEYFGFSQSLPPCLQ